MAEFIFQTVYLRKYEALKCITPCDSLNYIIEHNLKEYNVFEVAI